MANGKGLPRSLTGADSINGGAIQDTEQLNSGAATLVIDPQPFRTFINSGGTAGNEIVQLPSGAFAGQRKLIEFGGELNAADVIRINDDGVSSIQELGLQGETPTARTNVDLDTPGEYVLLEYQGNDVWNILYTTGAVS